MTQRVQGKEILRAVSAQAQRQVRKKPSRRVLWSETNVADKACRAVLCRRLTEHVTWFCC